MLYCIYNSSVLEEIGAVSMDRKNGLGLQLTVMVIAACSLLFLVSIIVSTVMLRNSLLNENKMKVKEVTELTINILEDYQKMVANGEMSKEQAQKTAIDVIKGMKYQGNNYIWIMDNNYEFVSHPIYSRGTDVKTITDKNGKDFFKQLVDVSKDNVFIDYYMPKQGESPDKLYPKLSTSQYFSDWGWVVATGVYVDEVNATATKAALVGLIVNTLFTLCVILFVRFTLVNKLVGQLTEMGTELETCSNQVSDAAYHLELSSQKLAEGSNEQAASVQEIAATIEESASMVQKSDENSKYAANAASGARNQAENSARKMEQLTSAMDKMRASNQEISKIIKVIDEIAFQTNILALNAAVEAARAGDAGKGFAVVAEEVRNLAQRSTQSAKETTELIENNINIFHEGEALTKEVFDSALQIKDDAIKVNELIQEVSVATSEQQVGIQQIHVAISQVEQVLQVNVQEADKTASASQQLTAQTASLNDLVDNLKSLIHGR